ncbi:minor tail protein, partial [Brevibacillus agri BAB-2500]
MGVISNLMFAVGFKINDAGLREAEEQIQNVTSGIVGFGIAAGAALAGFGIASVHATSQFEKAMSQVQAATDSSADQMAETKELAKNLYSENFGENWSDLGQAITSVKQVTGQTGEALEDTTRNALLLRDAFGFEINESVKGADTMMKQFGITSDQAF